MRVMAHTVGMTATAAFVDGRRFALLPSVVGETDAHLVARVRAGDDSAFEKIYDRYARGVLAFCTHMLNSREGAEDVVQLTFVSAYRAVRAGTNEIILRPWLYTIARNRCLSEIRARRATTVPLDEPPVGNDLCDQVERREDLREMLDDIARLPDDQRAALVLFELGDNSHKEIAAILGVRAAKVKALIFQARQGLARGRLARDHACREIREHIAVLREAVPSRGMTRAHIERCPSCAAFEAETRRQRGVLALILPVPLAAGLKSLVLGAVAHGGVIAAGTGVPAGAAALGGGVTLSGTAGAGRWRAVAWRASRPAPREPPRRAEPLRRAQPPRRAEPSPRPPPDWPWRASAGWAPAASSRRFSPPPPWRSGPPMPVPSSRLRLPVP